METRDSIPVLDYPRDLYAHTYFYRSRMGFMGLAGTAFLASVALWVGRCAPNVAGYARTAFTIMGILAGLAAGWLALGIAMNFQERSRLTTAGIETPRRFVPWSKVSRLAANRRDRASSVQMFYTVRIGSSVTINKLLFSGTSVPAAEYEKLIQLLRSELSASYPDLELGGYLSIDI